jgi:hypothetical protein
MGAAGQWSGRSLEAPLEAPREQTKLTARPHYEAHACVNYFVFLFIFFFFFFIAMAWFPSCEC